MRSSLAVIGALAFVFAAATGTPASAEPFVAGDTLRFTFDLSGLPSSVSDPYGDTFAIPSDMDLFAVNVNVASGSGVNTFTTRLYDGKRLLGSQTIPAAPILASPYGEWANFYFVSPSSMLGTDGRIPTTIIDFSSFLNGSIDGAIEFTMDAGQIQSGGTELSIGRAVSPNEAYGARIIPNELQPVPEPASLLLMATGLAALRMKARRPRNRARSRWLRQVETEARAFGAAGFH